MWGLFRGPTTGHFLRKALSHAVPSGTLFRGSRDTVNLPAVARAERRGALVGEYGSPHREPFFC